jgi:penicillin-binding protein 2
MYEKRIRVFVIFSLLLLAVCVLRLAQMQLLSASSVQHEIAELKRRRGQYEQFKTVRGRILDRNDNILATDRAQFWLHIDYELSCWLDGRVQDAMLLRASKKADPVTAKAKVTQRINDNVDDLGRIIDKCAQFRAVEPDVMSRDIQGINERVWNLRIMRAWRKEFPKSELLDYYKSIGRSVPISKARADFEQKMPDPNERLLLISKVDIIEMHQSSPLLELKTDDDIFAAQLEFMDTKGIHISAKEQRFYPYGSVAAQTIGWVGPATQDREKEFFAEDNLASYLDGEVCGRRPGVEYVCEAVLRGRRGEEATDIDGQVMSRTWTQFGKDVKLTLDIELQRDIEDYLLNEHPHDPSLGKPNISVVVIDVESSDILALVSLPVCDLNRVRYDYDVLNNDPNRPLTNRAINEQYPPGSVVKPLILIAGLETGRVTPREIINCPASPAPRGWPNCLIFKRSRSGHDLRWDNYARNAIKGSCNVYFSRLADRIEPATLQQWLFAFGYGQYALAPPYSIAKVDGAELRRNLRQVPGEISSSIVGRALSFNEMPPLAPGERRWFGIGQGSLRVTPLQVANTMATIARGGVFMLPRLFCDSQSSAGVDLGISDETLAIVHDGMSAVVNEPGGTAHARFEPLLRVLTAEDVKIYGKTGSTERPFHALFAGFAADTKGRKIAVAVVVEGGQGGSRDAAPVAREIIQLCIKSGYVGEYYFDDRASSARWD